MQWLATLPMTQFWTPVFEVPSNPIHLIILWFPLLLFDHSVLLPCRSHLPPQHWVHCRESGEPFPMYIRPDSGYSEITDSCFAKENWWRDLSSSIPLHLLAGHSCKLIQEGVTVKVYYPDIHIIRFVGEVSLIRLSPVQAITLSPLQEKLASPLLFFLIIPWLRWHMLLPLVWNAFCSQIISLRRKSTLWHLSRAFAKVHMVSEIWIAEVVSTIQLPN